MKYSWLLLLSVMLLGFSFGYQYHSFKTYNQLDDLKYYKEQNKVRIGHTSFSGEDLQYKIKTFDGGRSWYATDLSGYKILGPVEEIHPGLIEHLKEIGAGFEIKKETN